ncbi:MAG: hypothetical protein OEW04_06325 [Nitrospirota bacterium]|nr:hypothetical protein [Nitrospirota bacterium]
MPSRYQQLADAVEGYTQTGVSLVGSRKGSLYPAGFSDDMGIYYFIPKLAVFFGIPLDHAINLFFAGTALIALITCLAGLFLLYKQVNQRITALVILSAASCIALRNGDVYIIPFFFSLAALSWVLYAAGKQEPGKSAYLVFPIIAFLLPIANTVRSHSGTGILVFIITLFLAAKGKTGKKAIIVLAMLIAGLGPTLFFNHVVHVRNEYLKQRAPMSPVSDGEHPFWHSVYIGLGFIDNPYVEKYLDEVAIEKVRSVNPKARFLSPEYSEILRQETVKIVREHPQFVFMNLAAKAGVIALYFILFMNVGLAAACAWRKPWPIDLAFWAGLSVNSLFGLLVVPYPNYLLGFIAFASLYCLVSINHGLAGITVRAFTKKLFLGRRHICAE